MTITLVHFEDLQQGTGDPVYPSIPLGRRPGLANATFHELAVDASGNMLSPTPICVLVYTTAAIHIRIVQDNSPGNEATQDDPYMAADSSAVFIFQRKSRGLITPQNRLWIYAVADV